jgi:hypothetical protein
LIVSAQEVCTTALSLALLAIVVAYQSYVLTLLLVIQEFTAFSCAVLKDACLAFNAFCKST